MSKPIFRSLIRKRTALRLRITIFLAVVVVAAVGAAPASAWLYVATWTDISGAAGAGAEIDGYGFDPSDPAQQEHTFKVDLVRAGATIATATAQGFATIANAPVAAGDQVTVTDIDAGLSRTVPITGRPTLSDSVCGTPTAFSGTRDAGSTVWVSASLDDGASARTNINRVRQQTFSGTGTTFSGSFNIMLSPSWDVYVSEGRSFASGVTVFNDIERPVGACAVVGPGPGSPAPAPAVPSSPTPQLVPIKDIILPSARLTLHASSKKPTAAFRALLGGKFIDSVVVSEAGTVTQTLYLDDGAKLPKAAAVLAAAKKKQATVVGQGRATVTKPSVVKVTVKLSKKGRSRLRAARQTKLALVTAVRDKAGNMRVLAPTRLTVKRVKGIK
jgi:hypothetical protein